MCYSETITKNQTTPLFPTTKESMTLKEFMVVYDGLMRTTWMVDGHEFTLTDTGWSKGFNSRKGALGICKPRGKRIEISKPLLMLNLTNPQEWEDVVRHEIAHAIDYIKRGTSAHDRAWKRVCVQIGANPERLYDGPLEKPEGKYTLSCPSCDTKTPAYRKPKRRKSCGKCSPSFNLKYVLEVTQNY